HPRPCARPVRQHESQSKEILVMRLCLVRRSPPGRRQVHWTMASLLGLALCVTAPRGAAAQSTGKLEGRIRDQAGAPVAGAQIRVEGSAYGAVADSRGYYFINGLPAGN